MFPTRLLFGLILYMIIFSPIKGEKCFAHLVCSAVPHALIQIQMCFLAFLLSIFYLYLTAD